MNVTEYSQRLADAHPEVKWPCVGADLVFDFEATKMPRGSSLMLGSLVHDYLPAFIEGDYVPEAYADTCAVIYDILYQMGMDEVESEEVVNGVGLSGRIDMHGIDVRGRHWVVEVKCSQGLYLPPPSRREIFQMVSYAKLLDQTIPPGLICLRVNLRTRKVGVYRIYEYKNWLDLISDEAA